MGHHKNGKLFSVFFFSSLEQLEKNWRTKIYLFQPLLNGFYKGLSQQKY